MLNDKKIVSNDDVERKHYKIENTKQLNRFFMRKITSSILSTIVMFIIIILTLLAILYFFHIDDTVRISIISSLVTFIITTGKSIIDKFTYNLQYITTLLGEEQIGINKSLGIDVKQLSEQMIDKEQKNIK